MSTTTTYQRRSDLGRDFWIDMIQTWFGDEPLTVEDEDACFQEFVAEINDQLPGSLFWYPWTSELNGNVGDREAKRFTEEQFTEIANTIIDEVVENWYGEHQQ